MLRHTATDPGVGDPPGFRLDDCATQRNLSDAGRAEAAAIGASLHARGVSFARVHTSQWCRCRDTARLLALGTPEDWEPLNSFFGDERAEGLRRTDAVRAYLANRPADENTLLVTHQVNITALTNLVPATGEGVVVRVDDKGNLTIVGHIRFDENSRQP